MTHPSASYPQPREDLDNRPFLEAWRDGRLRLQTCSECRRSFFYPRPRCPHCWSDRLVWDELPGEGEVVSFSLIHRPNHSSFFDEVPIVLAELRVAEGVTLLARIVGVSSDMVRTGMRVHLLKQPNRYPLPTFEPDKQ